MSDAAAGQPDRPVLEVRAAGKRYPVAANRFARLIGLGGSTTALHDISFSVAPGETFGVLGEAGAGKTTLTRLLSGAEKPSSGQVLIDGAVSSNASGNDLYRNVGVVGPPPASQNLLATPDALAAVGFTDADPPQPGPDTDQRRQVAAAISQGARLVVVDEPRTSRGPTGATAVLRLLPLLKAQHGWTLVILSHDLGTVAATDRLAVLYHGRLVEHGPTSRVIGTPVHPYTQRFVENGPHAPSVGKPEGCPYHPICPYVMEICKAEFPPLEAKAPSHFAACHAIVSTAQGPAFVPLAGSARKLDRLRQREVMGTPE